MLRQLIEKTMKAKEGEQRFSPELRGAYFDKLGILPPAYDEHIERAGLREELGRFRIDVDLLRTHRGGGVEINQRILVASMPDGMEASFLVDAMNDPANLGRANRVLEESALVRDRWLVGGGVGVGLAVTTALYFI